MVNQCLKNLSISICEFAKDLSSKYNEPIISTGDIVSDINALLVSLRRLQTKIVISLSNYSDNWPKEDIVANPVIDKKMFMWHREEIEDSFQVAYKELMLEFSKNVDDNSNEWQELVRLSGAYYPICTSFHSSQVKNEYDGIRKYAKRLTKYRLKEKRAKHLYRKCCGLLRERKIVKEGILSQISCLEDMQYLFSLILHLVALRDRIVTLSSKENISTEIQPKSSVAKLEGTSATGIPDGEPDVENQA